MKCLTITAAALAGVIMSAAPANAASGLDVSGG